MTLLDLDRDTENTIEALYSEHNPLVDENAPLHERSSPDVTSETLKEENSLERKIGDETG